MTRIWDITRPVGPGIWVWPGDRAFESALTWKMTEGASCNVGQVTMSCHTGTHMDAPFHFSPRGESAESIPLEACVGPCIVLPIDSLDRATGERVLVRAAGGAPTVAQVERLAGLRLFGTDGPSVDPVESETLDAHHALWKKGAVILEGLDLSNVPDGEYELVALPVKLVGMDAAPVRAILLEK